ncbi:unnamed protein product [Rotaria sp. Silwood2]|nr:unnamed protein product [Rotaria sp. Silwood2]CAF4417380.1 unnamed protein product [Rotaria sp. Silwood2]
MWLGERTEISLHPYQLGYLMLIVKKTHGSFELQGVQEKNLNSQLYNNNYNLQIKNLIQQEKEYWKQLAQIIAKRTNLHEVTTNKLTSSSNIQPLVVINATFTMPIDKNNENAPPYECKSPVKIAKIRKKKKCIS